MCVCACTCAAATGMCLFEKETAYDDHLIMLIAFFSTGYCNQLTGAAAALFGV